MGQAHERRPKGSAEGTAVLRFAGSFDRDAALRNPDALAGLFLNRKFSLLGRVGPARRVALPLYKRLYPGAYGYQTARTRLFDRILTDRVRAHGVSQIVILGGGYDTRAYRFRSELEHARVWDTDLPETVARKSRRLQAHFGELAPHVRHIGIDLDRDDIPRRLADAGWDDASPSLFLWEGVSMFVSEAAVDDTLALVADAPAPSSIVFDYVVRDALEHPERYHGGRAVARFMAKSGEPWTFGVEHDAVAGWLERRGLRPIAQWTPSQLERELIAGRERVLGFHGIVHARAASGADVAPPA